MQNQPETKPDYFIQIPGEVLFDPKLPSGAKFLYGDVLFLNYTYGFCSQKNAYFAANHNVSIRTIENWISKLKAQKLIKIELIRNQNKEVELRKIFALVKIDPAKGPANQSEVSRGTSNEDLSVQKSPESKSSKQNKKPYGVNQNVLLTDKEVEEILSKITQNQFDEAIKIYGDWKVTAGATPRSDYKSMQWAIDKVLHSVPKVTGRMTAVQASGCDEVTEEMLENLPF